MGVATMYSAPAGYCCAPAAAWAACSINEADGVVTEKRFDNPKWRGMKRKGRSALAHLDWRGLKLVQRNYRVAAGPRARGGEIDLIVRERDGTLVFVEVRARRTASHGGAAGSVTLAKQRRVIYAAQHYLRPPANRAALPLRRGRDRRRANLEWLRAAFDAS